MFVFSFVFKYAWLLHTVVHAGTKLSLVFIGNPLSLEQPCNQQILQYFLRITDTLQCYITVTQRQNAEECFRLYNIIVLSIIFVKDYNNIVWLIGMGDSGSSVPLTHMEPTESNNFVCSVTIFWYWLFLFIYFVFNLLQILFILCSKI